MTIKPSEYAGNHFRDANTLRNYLRAQEMKADYDLIVRDIVQLDNQVGIDFNSEPGIVVLNGATIKNAATPEERRNTASHPLKSNTTGELTMTSDGKAHYSLRTSGTYLDAEINQGFLGLGKERLELTAKHSSCTETALFFADGTIDYKKHYDDID